MSRDTRLPSRRRVLLSAGGVGAGLALGTAGRAAAARRHGRQAMPPIVVTDQASRRLLVLDSASDVWDPDADPSVVRWAFSPLDSDEFDDLDPETSWIYPDEARPRQYQDQTLVLTTASFGFAAVVEYPTGRRYWAGGLGLGDDQLNPHTAELLPDGNVAVACSTGALVRLFAASLGPTATRHVDVELKGAHGLHWDDNRDVLWALGDDELVAYEVTGTPDQPGLRKRLAAPLPVATPGTTAGGHDLSPVLGAPDRLWVTTTAAVHQFDIATFAFTQDFPGADEISRKSVKAVGDDPATGQVLSTTPEPDLEKSWWTTTVSLHQPTDSRKLVAGGIYKARWWLPR